jgi:hypothetical protein
VDSHAVADRATMALIAGVIAAVVGGFVLASDAAGGVRLVGWAVAVGGAMTFQAGLIGYVLSATNRHPVR